MYISYSADKVFSDCPRSYYHKYVDKTPLPKPDNRVHMLYGDVVGKIFEAFYRDQLWKGDPLANLLALVRPTLKRVVEDETRKGGVLNWNEPGLKEGTRSLAEIEHEVRETIPWGLKSIKHHRLLGNGAQAEMVLDTDVEGHRIGGRADFVLRRFEPHGDLVIVDGKGSRWGAKYTNTRQLRWYAMLYWLKFGEVPARLGFLFWRYKPEESMAWSTVTLTDLEVLKTAILSTIKEIETAKQTLVQLGPKAKPGAVFLAKPGGDCKLCGYLPICPEGTRALTQDIKFEIAEASQRGVEDGEVSF